jgi:hypothetical protein
METLVLVAVFLVSNSLFAAEPLDIAKVSVAKNVMMVDANKKLQSGDILMVGTLVAGNDSESVLQLQWNDNKVLLNGKFKIKIESLNKKSEPNILNLVYGNLRALISKDTPQKDFKVKTPAAVVGVRGTDFMVSFNDLLKETEVICFESKIDFRDSATNKKPTVVTKGQWGGSGGRFGAIKHPIDLPENVLQHFRDALKFN